MKIKSLGNNKTELELRDLLILVSYETPVALMRFESIHNTGARQTYYPELVTSPLTGHWPDELLMKG